MTRTLAAPLALILLAGPARADDAPAAAVSYGRDVAPFVEEHCLSCHDEGTAASDLLMADVGAMTVGGRRGAGLVPGQGRASLIVQFLDGTRQPRMPPKTSIPRDQIDVLVRWIDQGAKVDALDPAADARRRERRQVEAQEAAAFASDAPPPVTSLAFSPDGKSLAVAGYKEVVVVDPATGKARRRLVGFPDQVAAVAYSPDGKSLAASSGTPGRGGEVRVWDSDGNERKVLRGHGDTILAIAWRPGSDQLATSSLDKLVLIWDVAAGRVVRTIKNHADSVTTLAFSPDGRRLASGSVDKTAKVHDAESGLQVASLAGHTDTVSAVAFSPDGALLATASLDKSLKTWKLADTTNPEKGFGHTGPVLSLAWRPDGTAFFAGSGGRPSFLSYKKENGNRSVNIDEGTMPKDWLYATAVSPDNQIVATGGWDGLVTIYSLTDGAKLRVFTPGRVD